MRSVESLGDRPENYLPLANKVTEEITEILKDILKGDLLKLLEVKTFMLGLNTRVIDIVYGIGWTITLRLQGDWYELLGLKKFKWFAKYLTPFRDLAIVPKRIEGILSKDGLLVMLEPLGSYNIILRGVFLYDNLLGNLEVSKVKTSIVMAKLPSNINTQTLVLKSLGYLAEK